MSLSSCLYDCHIWHTRRFPKRNTFTVSTFMFLVDLDEFERSKNLGELINSPIARMYSLQNADHIDGSDKGIRDKLLDYISAKSSVLKSRIEKIKLLTNLKFLNFVFNPISVYYCYDKQEELVASVVEVENTFRERKLYLLDEDVRKRSFEKQFYVSPFSSVDGQFEFVLDKPGEFLNLSVNHSEDSRLTFEAGMRAEKVPLTGKALALRTLRHPCSSLLSWIGIHLHAFALFLKRVPHHEKHEDQLLQKPDYVKTKSS